MLARSFPLSLPALGAGLLLAICLSHAHAASAPLAPLAGAEGAICCALPDHTCTHVRQLSPPGALRAAYALRASEGRFVAALRASDDDVCGGAGFSAFVFSAAPKAEWVVRLRGGGRKKEDSDSSDDDEEKDAVIGSKVSKSPKKATPVKGKAKKVESSEESGDDEADGDDDEVSVVVCALVVECCLQTPSFLLSRIACPHLELTLISPWSGLWIGWRR